MQTGRWTCGFFLVAAAVMAQTAPQNGKKLSARELFYAETAPPAPAKPAAGGQAGAPAGPASRPLRPGAQPARHRPLPPDQRQLLRHAGPHGHRSGGLSPPEKPLGLRYSFLRNAGGDEYREVDPDTVFRSGDRIRVAAQSNDEGYLYIVMKGTSGSWKVLFPSAEIADGSNRVTSGRQYLIPPPPGRFAFDEQAGEERLFIVLVAPSRAEPGTTDLLAGERNPRPPDSPPKPTNRPSTC